MKSKLLNMPDNLAEKLAKEHNSTALINSLLFKFFREDEIDQELSNEEKERIERENKVKEAARKQYKEEQCAEAIYWSFDVKKEFANVIATEWIDEKSGTKCMNVWEYAEKKGLERRKDGKSKA